MTKSETGFAEINGAKIYYEVAGEGQPFLMVHAGIASKSMWDDQFDFFAQKYKVVRYDMRGFGQSPPIADEYQRHEDIRALLDFLEIDHAYLMGCSMGGGGCMNFALEYPDRADALIMVGSGPSGFSYDDWSPSPLDEAMDAAYEKGDLEQVNEIAMRIFVDGTGRTPDQVNPALRKKVYDMNMIALQNEKLLGKDVPLSPPAAERIGELDLPVLIVIGDLDEDYISRAANFMVDNIPGARKIVMSGTAHLPNTEFPEAFNAHVQAFLDNL
ncbi:MAG: alpha/beta hydrolase [Anaerolineae bacterium]|nr:alpha/beta hydrolase [Anaerolineae bacterium]